MRVRHPAARRIVIAVTAIVLAALLAVAPTLGGAPRTAEPDIWLVRSATTEQAHGADRPFNPASLVKLATTLWALETLGPEHRFETTIGYRGRIDRESGTLHGDLLVRGGADPDFHLENAWLVAGALNAAGVRRVSGDLLLDRRMWIGWEGGAERRMRDPARRARAMSARLRDALDPERHDRAAREGIAAFHERRRTTPMLHPDPRLDRVRVEILGATRAPSELPESDGTLVVHRSNPLARMLKRFNSYSNNDIERLGELLGNADGLTRFVRRRLERGEDGPRFATLSGLGSNRMSARDVVRLLDELRLSAAAVGLGLDDLLPVAGCDPGTLERFSGLAGLSARGVVVTAKTGSLGTTDGGVATLAGHVGGAEGISFCTASLEIGGRLSGVRSMQDRWVTSRLSAAVEPADQDRGQLGSCDGAAVVFSDHEASALAVVGAGSVVEPASGR